VAARICVRGDRKRRTALGGVARGAPAGQPAAERRSLTTALEVPSGDRLADVGGGRPANRAALAAPAEAAPCAARREHREGRLSAVRVTRVNYGRFLYPTDVFKWGGNDWRSDLTASLQ
jgi:hypothetical protein